MYKRIAILGLIFICLCACSPTIGNRADLEDVEFSIGRTTKQEVADTLGFPVAMKKDPTSGAELWAYHNSPELSGIIWATPTSVTSTSITVTTFSSTFINEIEDFKDAAMICIFAPDGKLSSVKRNHKE